MHICFVVEHFRCWYGKGWWLAEQYSLSVTHTARVTVSINKIFYLFFVLPLQWPCSGLSLMCLRKLLHFIRSLYIALLYTFRNKIFMYACKYSGLQKYPPPFGIFSIFLPHNLESEWIFGCFLPYNLQNMPTTWNYEKLLNSNHSSIVKAVSLGSLSHLKCTRWIIKGKKMTSYGS